LRLGLLSLCCALVKYQIYIYRRRILLHCTALFCSVLSSEPLNPAPSFFLEKTKQKNFEKYLKPSKTSHRARARSVLIGAFEHSTISARLCLFLLFSFLLFNKHMQTL